MDDKITTRAVTPRTMIPETLVIQRHEYQAAFSVSIHGAHGYTVTHIHASDMATLVAQLTKLLNQDAG